MKKKEYIIPAVEIFAFESEHIANMSMFEDGGTEDSLTKKREENWPPKPGWSNPAPWEE